MAGERQLPGLGLYGYWTLGSNGYRTQHSDSLRKVSVLGAQFALSRATSLPGSPTVGDVYIVPSGDANGNDVAVREYDTDDVTAIWVYYSPFKGLLMRVDDEGVWVEWNGTAWVRFADAGIVDLAETLADGFVFDDALATPPGSPSEGDPYIVATGGTGDWAGHDGKLAVFRNGAWSLYAPKEGWLLYERTSDETLLYSGSAWVAQPTLADFRRAEVFAEAYVLDDSLTAPPGGESEGDRYIVAATATGDWAGQEGNIAVYWDAAWTFYSPFDGAWFYDRTSNENVQYEGSSWSVFSGGGGGSAIEVVSGGTTLTTGLTKLTIDGAGVVVTEPVADEITLTLAQTMAATTNKYIYTATASQTVFSGADDNSVTMVLSAGDRIDVLLNGVRLIETTDYTVNTGTDTITLTTGAAASDILEVDVVTELRERPAPPGNLLRNGAMQVWQSGTSWTGVSNEYTADQWKASRSTTGSVDVARSADVPAGEGFTYSLDFSVATTEASLAAGSYLQFFNRLEGQNTQSIRKGTSSAKELTVSFWVKSSTTGTYIVELFDHDNNRQVSIDFTIDSADTWEFKTITFPADTTGAFENDNMVSLTIIIWLAAGSTFSSGTRSETWSASVTANRAPDQVNLLGTLSNYFRMTGVQLEIGPAASQFEFKSYDEELAACQRYFYTFTVDSVAGGSGYRYGTAGNADMLVAVHSFPVTMRASPTVTTTTPTYTNCSNIVVSAGADGFMAHVDVTNTGRFRAFSYDVKCDARL